MTEIIKPGDENFNDGNTFYDVEFKQGNRYLCNLGSGDMVVLSIDERSEPGIHFAMLTLIDKESYCRSLTARKEGKDFDELMKKAEINEAKKSLRRNRDWEDED